jgi:hypothetical protein
MWWGYLYTLQLIIWPQQADDEEVVEHCRQQPIATFVVDAVHFGEHTLQECSIHREQQ